MSFKKKHVGYKIAVYVLVDNNAVLNIPQKYSCGNINFEQN